MRLTARFAACLLALLLFTAPAQASLYQGPALDRGWLFSRPSLEAALTLDLAAWPDLSPETLAALQGFFSGAGLRLTLKQEEGQLERQAILSQANQELLLLYTREGEEPSSLVVEIPGQLPAIAYAGTGGQSPWQALLGLETAYPDPLLLGDSLQAIAAAALPHLLAEEKAVKTAITVRHAGRGASQLVYALNREQAALFWAAASPQLLPELDRLFLALAPGEAAGWSQALRGLEMKGAFTLKRFLDKEGADLGLQITAAAALNGQTRKLTLFYGQSPSGVYLSFKLPATRGNDTLEAQLSLAYTAAAVKGDWKLKSRSGDRRLDVSGQVDLVEKDGLLTGSLEAEIRNPALPIPRRTLRLSPSLAYHDAGFEGSLRVQEYDNKTLRREALLTLTGAAAGDFAPPRPLEEVALGESGLPELAKARLDQALAALLNTWVQSLEPAIRPLVLHDLGRDRRAQGDSVPAPETNPDAFTVTDESLPTTPKEETP